MGHSRILDITIFFLNKNIQDQKNLLKNIENSEKLFKTSDKKVFTNTVKEFLKLFNDNVLKKKMAVPDPHLSEKRRRSPKYP